MFFKIFAYGFERENVLSFIQWWIKSENFSKDVKIGDVVDGGGNAIRDIDHTIVLTQNKFELIIEKGVITSDLPRRKKCEELYLNKNFLGENGFDTTIRKTKKWLEKTWDYDPYVVNPEKTKKIYDMMVGIGFFIENPNQEKWKLCITADVVGIPK